MNAINSDNFLTELENDFPFPHVLSTTNQPLIDEQENQEIDDTTLLDVEDLLNLVSPLDTAVPPPMAVMPNIRSTPAQLAATSSTRNHPSKASKKKARLSHNLYEKNRRQNINGKIRVLHELVPNSKKSDKASMLDTIIEYVKSLKLQTKMKGMDPMSSYYPLMPQASNPMWSPLITPYLCPYDQQVQLENLEQQFYSVQQEQIP